MEVRNSGERGVMSSSCMGAWRVQVAGQKMAAWGEIAMLGLGCDVLGSSCKNDPDSRPDGLCILGSDLGLKLGWSFKEMDWEV